MKKAKKAASFRGMSILLAMVMLISTLCMCLTSALASSSAVQNNLIPNASFERSEEPSKKLNAWSTLGAGFSIAGNNAVEGKNVLVHNGEAEETVTSNAFSVEPNEEYILLANMKCSTSSDKASIAVKDEKGNILGEMNADDTGKWNEYSTRFNTGEEVSSIVVELSAKGEAHFDGIEVCKTFTDEEVEYVVNGSFDGSGGWDANAPLIDVTDIGGSGKAMGAVITSQDVKIDDDTWYLYSADIYRDNLVTWKYLDMFPTDESMRLRGWQEDTWETVGGLWYSGDKKSTSVRLVVEGGWDNVSVGSASDVSKSFIDNVSLKRVDVSDNLVTDSGFANDGWQIVQNGKISNIGHTESTKGDDISKSFSSTMTDASQGSAIALANNGEKIAVEKNTVYVISAWIRVDGADRTLKTVLDMCDIPGELHIESTTYNHESKGNYWVFLTGMWNSGENTEVNLRASITPTNDSGAVSTAYIDDVSFRKANPQKWGKNLLINGGFEDYALEYSVENWDIPKEGLALLKDAQNGNKSVQLDGTTMLSDDIALEKNTEYLFSGWIKNTSATTAEISLGDIATLSSTKNGEWEYIKTTFNCEEQTTVQAMLKAEGGAAQFDGLYLDKTSNLFDTNGSKLSSSAQREVLESKDTSLTIAVDGDKMYIEKMVSLDNNYEWISADEAQQMPLVGYVNGKATDWKFVDKKISGDHGSKLLTLTFTNEAPAMELKAYWEVHPDEEGPVKYWAEIENKSGDTLTFEQKDIISGDLVVTADSQATLNYFERQTYTGLEIDNYTHCDEITAGYENVNVTRNEAAQTSRDYRLPYQVIRTSNGNGFYYGYWYGFGTMKVKTGDDPTKIRVSSYLGDSGTITRKLEAGDMDGDGIQDADLNLTVPAMFFGTFNGSLDEGCNRMKNWFWKFYMTDTLRENENEPLVELHLPFNSEKEWTEYLEKHNVADWGVQLLKQDYWWTVPNSPPSDGSFNWDLHQKWSPDKTKWPNGMTLGNIAHENGLQQSLYFCDTYELTDLLDWNGRNKNLNALSTRLKDWKIDYYRSDFAMQGPYEKAINNYAAYEGYMWMLDQLINDEELPTFRYESCSGGGTLKAFSALERMTFMTNEDSARAMPNRAVTYTDLYMINPAQIKMDIAIDWPAIEGPITDQEAYDYYVFRTGLLGAMMICPSTNLAGFSEHQIEVAKETYGIYNTKQRAIIRNCDVYHILPTPDGTNWDGIEYFNDDLGMGSILLYRPSSNCDYTEKAIYPEGLKPSATYRVEFEDNTDLNVIKTGAQLMENGINVRMDKNYDSEIIWLTEVTDADIPMEAITIYGATEMDSLESQTLIVGYSPINATSTELIWTSSNEDVAEVVDGKVTAYDIGKATITAASKDDPTVFGSIEITVDSSVTAGSYVWVNNTDPAIAYGEGSVAGGGGAQYYNGDETLVKGYAEFTFKGTKVKWQSAINIDCGYSDVYIDGEKVASVVHKGSPYRVEEIFESEELAPGEHTIKIVPTGENAGGAGMLVPLDALAYIPILEPELVRISGPDTVKEGEEIQLTAKVYPLGIGDVKVTWSTSDEGIAKVDENGKVTAVSTGTVKITAFATEDGSIFATKDIEVVKADTAPVITSPTQNTIISVEEGKTVTMAVSAESSLDMTYQWQVNAGNGWIDIERANLASYTTPTLTAEDNMNAYRCVVTNEIGSSISPAYTLEVKQAPTAPVIISPSKGTVIAVKDGETATLSITAISDLDMTYQWQILGESDWVDIEGANSALYTTPALAEKDDLSMYRCVVANSVGSISSPIFTVQIKKEQAEEGNDKPVVEKPDDDDETPATGDCSNIAIWLTITVFSAMGVIAILLNLKKRKKMISK